GGTHKRFEPFSEDEMTRWLIRIHNGVQQLHKGQAWGFRLTTHYGFWVPLAVQSGGWPRQWKYTRFKDLKGFIEPEKAISSTPPTRKKTLWPTASVKCWPPWRAVYGDVNSKGAVVYSCVRSGNSTVPRRVLRLSVLGSIAPNNAV